VAAAVRIRSFLPALVVAALAAGDVQIDFSKTHFSFVQAAPFLLGIAVLAILFALAERRFGHERLARPPGAAILAVAGLVLGALLFAGSLARGHHAVWPGYIGGVVCAAIAILATRPLFARVRARLDAGAALALPLYAEGVAILLAALSVVAPPVGPVALALLLWLLVAGRRREGQKYAGLRILR